MQTFADAVAAEVRRLIEEQAEIELSIMVAGNLADYAAYRERVGRLYAYRKVAELFIVAQENLEKRG